MNLNLLSFLIIFAPLVGFFISIIGYYKKYEKFTYISSFSIFISLVATLFLINHTLNNEIYLIYYFDWIKISNFSIQFSMRLDNLSSFMLFVVNFISFLVHIYSIGYMHDEKNVLRFFAYLNLFTFMMLFLVISNNLLQMFCAWEGVGLSSYLLINYWYKKKEPCYASIKAFVVNRIGDIGFVIAMAIIFWQFKTLDITSLQGISEISIYNNYIWLNIAIICLLLAAFAKSGQFGLHVWLPDAMQAPTPVSALLHAATMVTAGVFLVIRLNFLFEKVQIAKDIMIIVGLLTSIFTGLIAITQSDIKKIIAYSTCSQLGLMFLACGLGAYHIAFFHLFTHAFFKALLFLGAGSIIHALSKEQNIFCMGGLIKYMPYNFLVMMIGTLAITAVPFFAGYYSKDLIFESLATSQIEFKNFFIVMFIISTVLTSLYSFRLLYYVFFGQTKASDRVISYIHSNDSYAKFSLNILMIGAVFSGFIGNEIFVKQNLHFKWHNILNFHKLAHIPFLVAAIPLLSTIAGLILVFIIYKNNEVIVKNITTKFNKLYEFFLNKCYIDDFYEEKIVKSFLLFSDFLYKVVDKKIIDKFLPNGIAKVLISTSKILSNRNSGKITFYLSVMIFCMVLVIGFYIVLQLNPKTLIYFKNFMGASLR